MTIYHGQSRDENGNRLNTPTYSSWQNARKRCYGINHVSYASYGGRGITMSDEWAHFANFHRDMGDRPTYVNEVGETLFKSLDRIDPDGNYELGNCRWATSKEQASNKRPKTVGPAC